MAHYTKSTNTLDDTIKYYKTLLRDFYIQWTPEIEHKIIELYPDDIAIENKMMTIILDSLG